MSWVASANVWKALRDRRDLDPVKRILLLALADHADQHGGNAYPGQQTLADLSGVSVRTVRDALHALVTNKDLTETTKARQQRPAVYALRVGFASAGRPAKLAGLHSSRPAKPAALDHSQTGTRPATHDRQTGKVALPDRQELCRRSLELEDPGSGRRGTPKASARADRRPAPQRGRLPRDQQPTEPESSAVTIEEALAAIRQRCPAAGPRSMTKPVETPHECRCGAVVIRRGTDLYNYDLGRAMTAGVHACNGNGERTTARAERRNDP